MREEENKAVVAMRAGFTLIEILVAVAIIGILGTVAVQSIMGNIEKAKVVAARESVCNLANACVTYSTDHKKYPNSLNDLVTADDGEEPAIQGGEGALEDPWGTEFKYERNGKRIRIVSAGPDMEFGTEDDISNDKIKSSKSK